MSGGGRRILVNTLYRGLADLGSKLATTVLFVLMARRLGGAQFGVFTFALSLVTLVTVLGDFGQNSVLTREVARDRSQLDRHFVNNLLLKLMLAVPALALAIAVVSAASTDSETRTVVALLGTAVVIELLRDTCFAVFQAYERLAFIPLALISQRFLTTIVGAVALFLGAGVVAVAAIYLAGAAVAFVIAISLVFGKIARPRLEPDPRIWKPLMRAALPIGLAGVFGTVLFRVDMSMLAAFKSKAVVGQYAAAYRLFEATLFVGWSIGAAVYPAFARLTPRTTPQVGAVFERAIKFVLLVTAPAAIGATILAKPIVDLVYGSPYREAITSLRLLGPAICLYPVAYLSGLLLVARDRQRILTIVLGIVAVENIVGNLVLIPWLSLDGAALGTSVSQLLATVPLVIYAARVCGGVDWRRILAGPTLAAGGCAAAMGALFARPLFAAAAGLALYVVLVVTFERKAFPDDLQGVLDLLRRRPGGSAPLPGPDLPNAP